MYLSVNCFIIQDIVRDRFGASVVDRLVVVVFYVTAVKCVSKLLVITWELSGC